MTLLTRQIQVRCRTERRHVQPEFVDARAPTGSDQDGTPNNLTTQVVCLPEGA